MDIRKYAAKLQKMSYGEISFRLQQKARNTFEQARWKLNGGASGNHIFEPGNLARRDTGRYPFPAPGTAFYGLADEANYLRTTFAALFPDRQAAAVSAADDLTAHRFRLLGLDVELPGPIRWNHNPQTGAGYPDKHFSMMDTYNTEKYGDVKFVWELNRHQFFIELGKACFLTGERRYAEKIWEWLSGYIAQTPHKIGINNTSVLEHAVRIFSWVWAYYFTKDSGIWTPERTKMLTRSLLLQGAMIEENLSYYFSPYNHLIGELAALAFLGTVYGNSPRMRNWRDKYWAEMEAQVDKQFHPDGFTVEQASYYHHFTLGFYLNLVFLRRRNGLPVSQAVLERLEAALEFSMYLTRPDGRLPMLGDIDSARSIYFYQPDPMWDLRPFLALGAVLFERADMKYVSGGACEEVLWMLGREGVKHYRELKSSPPSHTSRALPVSGYYIMRDGWEIDGNFCLFDCGEIAHGVHKDNTPSAAHGHGDILSVELTLNGKPVIIDPGFHTYFGPLEWHRYFRATRGHNVIEVNRAGQGVHEGRLGWSHVSSPALHHWVSHPLLDFAGGAIDRFAGQPAGLHHRRYILFRKGFYILIIDEVRGPSGQSAPAVESSFHFVPGDLRVDGDGLFFNKRMVTRMALPSGATIQAVSGLTGPDGGWMCCGYGQKTAAPVLRLQVRQPLPVRFALLFPLKNVSPGELIVQPLETDTAPPQWRINAAGREETVTLNSEGQIWTPEAGLETDALAGIQSPGATKETEIHLLKVRHLRSTARPLDYKPSASGVPGLTIAANKPSDKLKIDVWP